MQFNEIVKKLRLSQNLTMEQLGEKIGLSSGAISDLEHGVRKNPRIDTLIKLADYFDVSLDELVGRERKGKKE